MQGFQQRIPDLAELGVPDWLEALYEETRILAMVLDPDGRIRAFNRACETLTGLAADAVQGQPAWRIFGPRDESAGDNRRFPRAIDESLSGECFSSTQTPAGEPLQICWKLSLLHDGDCQRRYVVAVGIELETLRNLPTLEHFPARSRDALLDALPGLVARVDEDFRVRYANRAFLGWFGIEPADAVGCHIREILGEPGFRQLKPYYEHALKGESAHFRGEAPYPHGGRRFVHATYLPARSDAGRKASFYALVLDLSAEQRLRDALAFESHRSRIILEHAIDAIIAINDAGTIESFNPAAEHLFGVPAASMRGHGIEELLALVFDDDNRSQLMSWLARAWEAQPRDSVELVASRSSGERMELAISVAVINEGDRHLQTLFLRDVTARNDEARAIRRALLEHAKVQRRSAVSHLAMGLAHEVYQPLAAVNMTAQACLTLLDNGPDQTGQIKEALGEIIHQTERVARIIQEMRDFLREDRADALETVEVGTLVRNVVALMAHETERLGIAVRVQLAETLPAVTVNRVQIEQALFNLVQNATDALAESEPPRRITIRGALAEAAGSWLDIAVIDNGPGIPEAARAKLFTPFFTTKPQGLGQGLAISRAIVEAHGGRLDIDEAAGAGTAFRIRLPVGDGR